jgi:hypothetical protein
LVKLEFSRQLIEKYSNIKLHENPSSGSGILPCGQTDRHETTSRFRNFVNAPKKLKPLGSERKKDPRIGV